MDSASPTTTTSSTNRGGRPKDWTDSRVRKLIRLYTYTKLNLPFILDVLECLDDGVWKPGKDAANKVKNALLGNDPRWLRPKDAEEEEKRITALKYSRRSKKHPKWLPSATAHEHENLDPTQYYRAGSVDDITLANSYQPSLEKADDVANAPWDPRDMGNRFDGGAHDDDEMVWFPQLPFINRNTARQDTGLTTSTDISMNSGIREKLSPLPRPQAKDILRLVKRFTIPKHSDNQQSPVVSPSDIPNLQLRSPVGDFQAPHELANHEVPDARYAVPGDFLNGELFRRPHQCPAQSYIYQLGMCWCRIVNEVPQVLDVWEGLGDHPDISLPGLSRRDTFGNTVFHYFATRDGIHDSFIRFVSEALQYAGLPTRDTNTAGQTFLHVLHPSWFSEEARFRELCKVLDNTGFDMLATDVYGRNIFHVIRSKMGDSARFPPQHTREWNSLNRRDAFGVKPMALRSPRTPDPNILPSSQSGDAMEIVDSPRADIPSDNEDTSGIRQNTAFIELIINASSIEAPNPLLEDSRGRNGLHCLAEVNLDMGPKRTSSSNSRQSKKRRYSEDDEQSSPESKQSKRVQLLEGLLLAKIDVNHYDEKGYTPLMAFVTHGRDDSRWEKHDLEKMIRLLVRTGQANMEARNREGETALYIAARRGQKVALKTLLELGANPNVRNVQGLGILAVIDEFYCHTERDGGFGARLEVCRGLLTGRSPSPVLQEPTLLTEWAKGKGKWNDGFVV